MRTDFLRLIKNPVSKVKPKRAGSLCVKNQTKAGWKPNVLHSPGHRPGYKEFTDNAPCKGNSNIPLLFLELPLQGALVVCIRLPRAMPWAVESCPFGAHCILINACCTNHSKYACTNHSKYRMSLNFELWFNNSKFKTQNSKSALPTIQNSKLKTQNRQRRQFKIQNSKLKTQTLTVPGLIPNSSLKHLLKYDGEVNPTS